MLKILEGKKLTSIFDKDALKKCADFFYFYCTIDNLNLLIMYTAQLNKTTKLAAAVQLLCLYYLILKYHIRLFLAA